MKQTFEPDQTVYLPDGREAIYIKLREELAALEGKG